MVVLSGHDCGVRASEEIRGQEAHDAGDQLPSARDYSPGWRNSPNSGAPWGASVRTCSPTLTSERPTRLLSKWCDAEHIDA